MGKMKEMEMKYNELSKQYLYKTLYQVCVELNLQRYGTNPEFTQSIINLFVEEDRKVIEEYCKRKIGDGTNFALAVLSLPLFVMDENSVRDLICECYGKED